MRSAGYSVCLRNELPVLDLTLHGKGLRVDTWKQEGRGASQLFQEKQEGITKKGNVISSTFLEL